jgi:cation-transporting ATPase E
VSDVSAQSPWAWQSEPVTYVTPPSGLTAAQVAKRVADGRTNTETVRTGRTWVQIVRANAITPFNGLLATLCVIVLTTGQWQNALFGQVIIYNTAIGIIQELRARRTLDKLAVLNAPAARVLRDGTTQTLGVGDIVADDLLDLRTGDQVPADAYVVSSAGLEADESLLTGESEPVPKHPGDAVRSGSIIVAGQAFAQATAVGADSYAQRIAAEARRFSLTSSELVRGTNKLLRWISLIMICVAPLLVWSQFRSTDNGTWQDAITGIAAGLVGMIPEGLVLLTTLAFAVAVVTLARRKTLVQELPAVEGLARVDVVCLDKTGTLTQGEIEFDRLEVLTAPSVEPSRDQGPDYREALGLLTASDPGATGVAIAARFPAPDWTVTGSVPFSSARKWSAVTADGHGTWVLGAPEMVLADPEQGAQAQARARADELAGSGQRVLMLAQSGGPGLDLLDRRAGADEPVLPEGLTPVALVVLAEKLREDAADTLRYFAEQGVTLKVISGDNPRTVGAVAARVGVPGVTGPEDAIDARSLAEDIEALAGVMETSTVFGRVTPAQKRAMVAALQHKGHVVAMTGDGVNDALALKDADIGVAMGSGSPATRAVAQLVLLDNKFSHLPDVVAEGRRVIANIERAANLFLVKNVYSLVLTLIVAVTGAAFPLAPIQMTLISTVTIGVPGFFLAMGPNRRRYVPGFLRRVLRFAAPVGVVIAIAGYATSEVAKRLEHDATAADARTASLVAILVIGLWIVTIFARPLHGWKVLLVLGLAGVAAVVFAVPALGSGIFLIEFTWTRLVVGLVAGAVGAVLVEFIHRRVQVKDEDPPPSARSRRQLSVR